MPGDEKPPLSPSRQTVRVIFQGRVQGVGFRYRTSRIARSYPITGYVKNLSDGTVELVARGRAGMISAFIEEIRRVMAGNLTDFESCPVEVDEEFADFSIRY